MKSLERNRGEMGGVVGVNREGWCDIYPLSGTGNLVIARCTLMDETHQKSGNEQRYLI